MTDGGIKCWGWNEYGQLGNGTTMQSAMPVDVRGLTGGVGAIAVGGAHTCALTTGGGAKCWGYNWYGQLGNGKSSWSTMPVDVISACLYLPLILRYHGMSSRVP